MQIDALTELLSRYGFSVQYDSQSPHEERWTLSQHINSFESVEELVDWIKREFEGK